MKTLLTLGLFFLAPLWATADDSVAPAVIPLWTGDAPGSEGRTAPEKREQDHVSSIHHPSLTVYLPAPARATGAAVIVCPGGGHRFLAIEHEGYAVGRWLAEHGIAAFVLKYRLAREEGSTYQVEVHALADAQRALRLVRSRAVEWGVDPARLGIMGFSAGGELAALAGRKFDAGDAQAADPIDRLGCKPAFQALIYPGNSKAIAPDKDSPPAFLACGYDDRPDISEGLASVYLLFRHAGVPAELHIYTGIGHGFGLRDKNTGPYGEWPLRLREWLGERGFLGKQR